MEQDWYDNPFAKEEITKQSVFFYGVIVDYYQGSYERWLHFPNAEALLGFMSYIFVPTAFYTFLSEEDEISILNSNLDELLDIMKESHKCQKKELITLMREFSTKLGQLWNCDINALKNFSIDYNAQWNKGYDKFSYFKIFESPNGIGKHLVEVYEKSDQVDISMLEEQLGVSKEEWINICNHVYVNDFMKRRFIEVLNNRIIDMV